MAGLWNHHICSGGARHLVLSHLFRDVVFCNIATVEEELSMWFAEGFYCRFLFRIFYFTRARPHSQIVSQPHQKRVYSVCIEFLFLSKKYFYYQRIFFTLENNS